ncbi:SRPBCC family protein [Agromyces sp. MMS24-K17]|uniref:SRPBCC family protein n=1 Tax=Agromyces sp. MMS24-K17 TaxID=3372850 RepID=UPI003754945D
MTWRAWHFGVPFRMTSRITEYERPSRFVDEQVRGPFAGFRHVHRFEAAGGRTTMVDEVGFAAPFGWLGRMVEPALRAYLRRLIEERNAHLRSELELRG